MKKNNAKRALLMSALSLLLCVSMLVGTTFAWFTDSVTSANNIIKSGNLDVEMYWAEGTEDPNSANWKDASQGAIFDYDNWEPGYVQVRHIKIANEGTLALKYKVSILANGTVEDLSDVIDVYYVDPAVQVADRAALTNAPKLGTLTEVLSKLGETGNGELEAGESDTITLAFKMQESAGNEYQDKSIGTDFSVQLFATQLTHEDDSFDAEYDTPATYPVISQLMPIPETPEDMLLSTANMDVTLPVSLVEALGDIADALQVKHSEPRIVGESIVFDSVEVFDEEGNIVDLESIGNGVEFTVKMDVSEQFTAGDSLKVYHDNNDPIVVEVDANGFITYTATHFCQVVVTENPPVTVTHDGVDYGYSTLQAAMDAAQDGDSVTLRVSTNTTDDPLTETITVSKNVTLIPNGMYLVSSAPATFTVVEGGKLTVTEGSFTIKNTATEGAAVLLEGGEFDMQGGSFDAYSAVRTTTGKSSVATLTAGWSNRVTIGFDSKGNDTINVVGGSLYTSKEAVKTTAGTHVNFNMSGGLLSSKTTQYSAAVNLQGTATVNMTGGKIENTYSSGYNGSSAIEANVAPTSINLSGTAALSSNGVCVMLGSHWSEPAVQEEIITLNMSGNASISATSVMGFGIRYAQDGVNVNISGNAKVNATYQAIQFNTNNYVYTNSTLVVSENATITSTAGRIGGGNAIASNGHVTITGGTINGSTAGVASFQEGAVVIVDNSASGTPITINKVDIAESVTYTVAGNPSIG